MDNTSAKTLQDWIDGIEDFDTTSWSQLPELDLYMDQILTLMNRQLPLLSAETDRPLTPSMINNYVKDGVMPRPHQKKYNREHLTALSIICMLKSELSLPEIRELVTGLSRFYSTEELYTAFYTSQTDYLRSAATDVANVESLSEADRFLLAMKLALDANAKRIAASRLLASLVPEPQAEKEHKKKKEKGKEKSVTTEEPQE